MNSMRVKSMVEEQVTVLAAEDIAKDIYRLCLHAPQIVAQGVRPGQFVHIRVPGDTPRLLRRPISVMAARPESETVELAIQVAGEGTRMLRAVRRGDRLSVLGPLGTPFDPRGAKRLFFVGGGIGAAPIRCAMDAFAGQAEKAVAFFGFRGAAYAYGLEDAPCEVRVSTDDGTMGRQGKVTLLLQAAIDEEPPDLVMACGPTPMLRTLQNMTMRQRIACQISLEEYMACGLGACLTCSCKARANSGAAYRRVCADGPVFDAREVCLDV